MGGIDVKVTNEKGYSFEIDKEMTSYGQCGQSHLPPLPSKYSVVRITKEDEFCGVFLFDTTEQKPLTEPMGVEEMGVKIDLFRRVLQDGGGIL